mmetsp:Transcript_44974/g.143270  ORF Transcript_44974/g.143270 Transcript_44974/m.143270 type:complete len:244 (-) Transcript_44974:76-807(-)
MLSTQTATSNINARHHLAPTSRSRRMRVTWRPSQPQWRLGRCLPAPITSSAAAKAAEARATSPSTGAVQRTSDAAHHRNPGSRNCWKLLCSGGGRVVTGATVVVAVLGRFTPRICGLGWRAEAKELSLTLFKCAGHEQLFERLPLPLTGGELDQSSPDADLRAYVEQVLAAGSDLAAYLPDAQRPGSREGKYRDFRPGASLVVFAEPPLEELEGLRAAVDMELPGAYAWLKPTSLHCTLRGIF